MAVERMEAQIVVGIDKKSLDYSAQEIERLKSPTALKMGVDLGALRRQLELVKDEIKKAKASGSLDAEIKFRGDAEILKKQITNANRDLINFVRTGDKNVSVLGKMFDKLGVDINSGFGKVLGALSGSMAGVASSILNTVGGATTQVGQKLNTLATQARESGNTISASFGGAFVAGIGAGLVALGIQAIYLGDKFEQAQISFEVMLGSAEKAKILLEDLSTFASKTPFEIGGIRESAKLLLAYGIGAEDIIGTLKILGDSASATGTPLEQIARVYGQVRTSGRLMAQDMNQFTSAGIPIIDELAKSFGVTGAEIKKMSEEGKIGFGDVQKAFQNLTGEGGKFFNLMERQSTTLTGKISTLKDNFSIFLEQIGGEGNDFAKGFIDMLSAIFNGLTNFMSIFNFAFALVTSAVTMGINNVVNSFQGLVLSMKFVGEFVRSLFVMIADNANILGYNIGVAFSDIPNALTVALNLGLKKIEDFVNSAGSIINSLAKQLGFEGNLVGTLKINPILGGGNASAFKSFKEIDTTGAQAIIAQRAKQNEQFVAINAGILASFDAKTNKILAEKGPKREIDTSISSPTSIPEKLKKEKGKSASQIASEQLKAEEERLTKLAEMEIKEIQNSTLNQKRKSETIIAVKEKLDKDIKALRGKDVQNEVDSAKDSLKAIEEAEKKKKEIQKDALDYTKKVLKEELDARREMLKETEENIKKLQDGLKDFADNNKKMLDTTNETALQVAERYKSIKEEIDGIKESQSEATPELKKFADFFGQNIFKGEFDNQVFGETKVKEIRDYVKEQQRLIDLEKEMALAKANTNQSSIAETGLSETEKILAEAQKKKQEIIDEKLAIEERLGLKRSEAEGELTVAIQKKNDLTAVIDEYQKTVDGIEARLTDTVKVNTEARMALYAQEEDRLRRLIALRTEAGLAYVGAPTNNNTTTNNNNPTVIVNATVSNTVDVNTLGKGLANEITLANKGIKK